MTASIAIIGFGVTGQSVARFLNGQDIPAVVVDTRPAPDGVTLPAINQYFFSARQWPDVAVQQAVLSPGLKLDACIVDGARAAGVQLRSDIDLFFDYAQAPVIGITGTNGKSTVTSLAGHLLRLSSITCGVGGNLGVAALDILDAVAHAYVLELSSFQLERSGELGLHSAAILNISADHLDQHGSLDNYVQAKQRAYAAAARIVCNRHDPHTRPPTGLVSVVKSFGLDQPATEADWGIVEHDGRRHYAHGSQPVIAVADCPLQGAHNEMNVLAACALVDDFISHSQIAMALPSFAGLAHRFQTVAQIAGVDYINDSKATNVGATQSALQGFDTRRVILIAGGDAKQADLTPLIDAFAVAVKCVIALGKDRDQIAAVAAEANVPCHVVADLPAAVQAAAAEAHAGDTVLLSPACASLDMFSNFEARGQAFVAAVQALPTNRAGGDDG